MTEDGFRHLLREVGAVREGHFLLTTGRHSPTFFQLARLFERPEATAQAAQALARRLPAGTPRTVVGPAMGGVILAYAVAEALGGRALYTEKEGSGRMTFRRGFRLDPGEEVLLVEDVLTTGMSTAACGQAVRRAGGRPRAAAVLVRRARHPFPLPVPLTALTLWEVPDHPPETCPQCRQGMPLERPKAAPPAGG